MCSLPLPREMALRRMAPCGSVNRASHGQQKACMACPSGRVQRAPGAYPTRCVGVRGIRVRALKHQRVCVRRRSVAWCLLDRTRLLLSLPITHSAHAKATPMGRNGTDKYSRLALAIPCIFLVRPHQPSYNVASHSP